MAAEPIPEQLAQADTVIELGVDDAGVRLSKIARSLALDTVRWLRTVPPDLPRKEGHRAAGVSQTKGLELEGADILEGFASGARIRITSRSIARRRIALAILSHPADGPSSKIRQPKARFQKRRREPTPQELAALQRANDARREGKEARKRGETLA